MGVSHPLAFFRLLTALFREDLCKYRNTFLIRNHNFLMDSQQSQQIERIERNIHRIQVDKEAEFLLISDLHWDNPKCDRALLTKHLKEAQERKAKILINGDFFCMMQGKYDPRRSKKDIRPEHNKANYIDAVIEDAVQWFKPYAHDIMLIGYGNHCTSIIKALETDPLQRFVDLLNMTCGSNVQVGGYGGVVDFKIHMHNNSVRTNVAMKYYHGTGGGGAVTKGVIQDQRMIAMTEGYDIIWMGHVHELYHHVNVVECYDSHQKKLKLKEVHQIRTSAYKEEYEDGFGGFHIEKGRPPKPLGGYWMKIGMAQERNSDGNKQIQKWIEFTATR